VTKAESPKARRKFEITTTKPFRSVSQSTGGGISLDPHRLKKQKTYELLTLGSWLIGLKLRGLKAFRQLT
jgi:hypothetical protein